MIFYLTYNDLPSGIFSSQVIDAVRYFNSLSDRKVKLISFISIRNFFTNRNKIKSELSDSIVLPMFPGIQNWKRNACLLFILQIIFKPRLIIGRGIFACNLALMAKSKSIKIIYDGRGAISAEWNEYKIGHPKLQKSIYYIEKMAVLNSDFRISVSEKLVNYWNEEFGYNSNNHFVIPCTLNTQYENLSFNQFESHEVRNELGFDSNDIIFVYSGSNAGWQSFDILKDYLENLLITNERYIVLFLSGTNSQINELILEFPNRIKTLYVDAKLVPKFLMACDYGLLIRESSITNSVASPVKFAEYLACGLPVIISENIGDYSSLIEKSKILGCIYSNRDFNFVKPDVAMKSEIISLANQLYLKSTYINNYLSLISL